MTRPHNGSTYRSGHGRDGQVRVYWDPESTSGIDPVTAGFERTLGWMVQPPLTPSYDPWRAPRRLLMVLGALILVAGACWLGAFLASSAFCPCTIGGL